MTNPYRLPARAVSHLQFDIIGYGRNDREDGYLFGLNFNIAISRAAGLVEIDEIRVLPAISVVYAENPFPFHFSGCVFLW